MENSRHTFFGLHIDDPKTPKILLFGVIGLWILSAAIISIWCNLEHQGQIGDMFGAVNSLFSGLAFAGIIYTILLQREELNEQRKELQLTRKEFEHQNETLYLQRFENTFFSMLGIHHSIIDNLVFDSVKGRNVLIFVYQNVMQVMMGVRTSDLFVNIEKTYNYKMDSFGIYMEHYFSDFVSILLLIDQSDLLVESERKQYFDIVLSQKSNYEKVLLFYHIVLSNPTIRSNAILKELEKRRKLFKDIDSTILANADHYNLMFYTSIYTKE